MSAQSDLDRIVLMFDEVRIRVSDSSHVAVSALSITAKSVAAKCGIDAKRYVEAVRLGKEQGLLSHHGSSISLNADLTDIRSESLFTVTAARDRAHEASGEAYRRHDEFLKALAEELQAKERSSK